MDNMNIIEYGNINVNIVSNVNMADKDNASFDGNDDDADTVVVKDSVFDVVNEE